MKHIKYMKQIILIMICALVVVSGLISFPATKVYACTIYSYNGDGGSCGFQFDEGQGYLVYSYLDKDNLLQTNLCSGNIPISQAGDEINQLGLGTVFDKDADIDSNQKSSFIIVVSVGIILMITKLGLVIWRIRKQNKLS